MVQQPEAVLPKEISEVIHLQTPNGQWRLCKRLYHALGRTSASIPRPPDGVSDGRWATALAVTFLRRRPDVIDLTYQAYSRAIAWVDEPLLKQAHTRLPPPDLYYPVDQEASRQGRWQQQAGEALEECGYAYFLPLPIVGDDDGGGGDDDGHGGDDAHRAPSSSVVTAVGSNNNSAEESEQDGMFPSSTGTDPRVRGEGKRPRVGQRRYTTPSKSVASRRGRGVESRLKAAAASAQRDILQQQSHGLQLEVKRAMRVASSTFKEGDRVESRWRRPTRLDKPRFDPEGWHPGCVVQSHKDGRKVDVLFEDGDGERLSGIPAKYVRLAPSSSSLRRTLLSSSEVDDDAIAATGGEDHHRSSSTSTPTPMPTELLCPASCRELAYIASANKSLRLTWEDAMPIGQELVRLRMMGEEKMRDRPEWRGSFPLVNFQATKRLSLGGSGMARVGTGAGAGRVAAAAARDHRRPRRQARDTSRGRIRARSRTSAAALSLSSSSSSLVTPRTGTVQAKPGEERREQNGGQRNDTGTFAANDASTIGMRGSTMTHKGTAPLQSSALLLPSSSTALGKAQSKLVTAAMAYDRCLAGAKDCLDRGATAFRTARTYSEQQKAFEESTATLGPAQPARAGYKDWRGSPVVGLQNATLDVVEAMDAWAVEWAAAREEEHEAEHAVRMCSNGGGGGNNSIVIEGEEEVQKDGVIAPVAITAPPFLWEGTPLVSTIIGHSAKLVAGAPELKEWYGPGFPIERNPFFLAYPVDDRPVTPRNALVRAWVNGEMVTTISRMLLEEREKEEAALKVIVDKQASAPSWWPTCRAAAGGGTHYERIRRAERIIARAESQVIKGKELLAKNQEATTNINIATSSAICDT